MATWTRYADTLSTNKAYGRGQNEPVINLAHGAGNGWLADYPGYISNTPYVRKNLILRLMAAPGGFQYLPEPERWVNALKALVETIPQSVTGFNQQLNVEVKETTFGANEKQEVVSNVTRTNVKPVFNYVEKYGRPITHFFDRWTQELLQHEDSKYPGIIHRIQDNKGVSIDMLPDMTSMTFMAFEPSPTLQGIDKGWIIADSKPKEDLAPHEAQRNIHEGGELVEFPINMTGIGQGGPSVRDVCLKTLLEMQFGKANPIGRQAFTDGINGNVLDSTDGIAEQLEEIGKNQRTGI